jgi:hypothetical protein
MDTSYAVALASPQDEHHSSATLLYRRIESQRIPLVTTRAVMDNYERDPLVHVTPLSENLFERGRALYQRHRDKEWGLTDCISFIVMAERGLTEALTADAHFRQAGFQPLLRPI